MQVDETSYRWAVVGGGMLGLATAWRLSQRGQQVTLFEASPEMGGLTSAWKLGDVQWDRFYHVTLLSDTRLRELLDEIGLEKEIEWVQTRTGFYSGGQLHSMSNSIEFLKFPLLNLIEKFRLGSTIFFGSKIKNWRALEAIPVETWLRRWSGNSTFKKIWLPLIQAKLGDAYQRTSAAFIWSYIDRMYKARRSGMKKEMFGYVPGGYARILATLSDALQQRGVVLRTGSPIHKVRRSEDSRELILEIDRLGRIESHRFDRVVMTIPSSIITRSCPELTRDEHQQLASAEYLGVICTSLLLKQPLGGFYVTNITDPGIPLTGVIEMGSIVHPEKLGGHYLVYLPRYCLADDDRFEEPDDSIHERCLQTLARMYPKFDRSQVSAIQTARARHVMALPTLRYSEQRPPIVSSIAGLYLLNSAQIVKGNLNVNETLELLAEHIDDTLMADHRRMQAAEMQSLENGRNEKALSVSVGSVD